MPLNSSHVTPTNLCPHCGYMIDRASGLDGEQGPRPGDVTLCLRCAEVSLFGATLQLEIPPAGFMDDWQREDPAGWSQVIRAQRLIRETASKFPFAKTGGNA